MKEGQQNKRLLSVGAMAKANSVTAKTLRLYHERGLLEPAVIDPDTGYRYYSAEQGSELERILHLQTAGFTLDEIVALQHMRAEDFVSALEKKRNDLEAQKDTIATMQRSVDLLLRDYQLSLNVPPAATAVVEKLPRRPILAFPINDTMRATDDNGIRSTQWNSVSRAVRATMAEEGISLNLFQRVGSLIPKEDLMSGSYEARFAYVFTSKEPETNSSAAKYLRHFESGTYFTIYHERVSLPLEATGLLQDLLRQLEISGFVVAGDYHDEVITDIPQFIRGDYDEIFKMSVRVEKASGR